MICFPNAKINIGLFITEKRADGFHNLESIFVPIALSDILEFVETIDNELYTFVNTGLAIDGDTDNNLVIKAYKLLQATYKLPPLAIHLHKIIPFGAGLGGGSADAAFMLSALNEHFTLNLSKSELKNFAQKIGSDCSFFIENKSCLATGRGEILKPIDLQLSNYKIILVQPNVHVSTKEAYSKVIPEKREISLENEIIKPISEWKYLITNDFEKSIFEIYPEIQEIKNEFYKNGALYSSMSGSGSSVFGIFDNEFNSNELVKYFEEKHPFVWEGKLL